MAVSLRSSTLAPYGPKNDPGVLAPAGVLSGDVLIILGVVYDAGGTPSLPIPPAPWLPFPGTTGGVIASKVPFGPSGAMRLFGWYKVSAGSEPSGWLLSQSSAGYSGAYWCAAYTGADNGTPIASGATSNIGTNTGSGASSTALSVTTPANGSQVVVVNGDNGDLSNALSIAGTTPTFTTEVSPAIVLAVFDGTLATAGATGNKTFNNNSAIGQDWLTAMFVISATVAGSLSTPRASSVAAASASITRPGPGNLTGATASARSAASAGLTTGVPLIFYGVPVNLAPMLETALPPTGYVRALPGIVQSEWSNINGSIYYLGPPGGDTATLCIDSSGNLVAYQDPLRPGQLVPASSVIALPPITATNAVVARAASVSAATAALTAPGPAPMTAHASGISAATATVTAPTVGGAVALRSSSHLGYGSHTSPSIPAPATIVNGDVLLLVCIVYGSPTAPPVIAPTGFTAVPGSGTVSGAAGGVVINDTAFNSGVGDNMVIYAWTKVAASESGAYAVTQTTTGSGDYWMGCYSGVDNTTPVAAGWTTGSGAGQTSSVASVTTTLNGSAVMVISGDNADGSVTVTIPGSTPTFTNRIPTGAVVLGISDGVLATAGATGAKSFTNDNAGSGEGWVAAMLVLNS